MLSCKCTFKNRRAVLSLVSITRWRVMLSCKCTFKKTAARVLPLVSITRWRVMLSCKCTFKNPVPPSPFFL